MSIPASVSALREMAKQVNAYFDGPLTNALLTGTDTDRLAEEKCRHGHRVGVLSQPAPAAAPQAARSGKDGDPVRHDHHHHDGRKDCR